MVLKMMFFIVSQKDYGKLFSKRLTLLSEKVTIKYIQLDVKSLLASNFLKKSLYIFYNLH